MITNIIRGHSASTPNKSPDLRAFHSGSTSSDPVRWNVTSSPSIPQSALRNPQSPPDSAMPSSPLPSRLCRPSRCRHDSSQFISFRPKCSHSVRLSQFRFPRELQPKSRFICFLLDNPDFGSELRLTSGSTCRAIIRCHRSPGSNQLIRQHSARHRFRKLISNFKTASANRFVLAFISSGVKRRQF